jgi:RNA-binding protein YhbY
MAGLLKIQLGKNGLSDNFFLTLDSHFKNHKNLKISVLKSARESKQDTLNYSKKILEHLGDHYTARVIGHTICLKKWRKSRDEQD